MQLGDYGRRSLLFLTGDTHMQCCGDEGTVVRSGRSQRWREDPFAALRELLSEHETSLPAAGAPLCGAAVGYLGYDLGHFVEELPRTVEDDLGIPDLWLHFCPVVITFDNHTGECRIGWTDVGDGEAEELAHRAIGTLSGGEAEETRERRPLASAGGAITSNFERDEYVRAVERVREYIYAGDIYQVNLSQRFASPMPSDAWDLYQRLRHVNPAPFAAFLDCGDFHVLSASPERFLRLDPATRHMHTRPIKGTRPRDIDPTRDRVNAEALVASAKDQAEHVMIVDLERNDLGRVAEAGSVRVAEMAALEAFPTVFHLTSTVEATLRADCDRVDLLRATFPGGSITGAPKIRAMEIIDELEPTKRGVYTGAIGYFGFDGSMDLNIVIRTMVVKEGVAYFHAGGGIVADSDPEAEYQETLDKAKALMDALRGNEAPTA